MHVHALGGTQVCACMCMPWHTSMRMHVYAHHANIVAYTFLMMTPYKQDVVSLLETQVSEKQAEIEALKRSIVMPPAVPPKRPNYPPPETPSAFTPAA